MDNNKFVGRKFHSLFWHPRTVFKGQLRNAHSILEEVNMFTELRYCIKRSIVLEGKATDLVVDEAGDGLDL